MVKLALSPNAIRYGDHNITAVYWKDELIWPEAAPPPPPPPNLVLDSDWENSDGVAEAFDVGGNLRLKSAGYDLIYNYFKTYGGDAGNPKRFRISWQVETVEGADCWMYVFDTTAPNYDFVKEDGVTPIYEALTPGAGSVIYDEAVNTVYLGGAPEAFAVMVELDDATEIDFVGGFLVKEI